MKILLSITGHPRALYLVDLVRLLTKGGFCSRGAPGTELGSIGQKFMMDCVQSCCRVAHFDAKYVESAEKAERSCSELGLEQEHYILIGSYTHPHEHAIFALNDYHNHHYPASWSIR